MSNHVKIRPVRTDLFHADVMTDRQTDRRTDKEIDMTKLIVAFRNFANALKKNKTQGLPILIYAFYKDIKGEWGASRSSRLTFGENPFVQI